jgi:hypothetical protein
MSYRSNDKEREKWREKIRRELEVKKLEEQMDSPANLNEIQREIHGEIVRIGNMKVYLNPAPKRKKHKLNKKEIVQKKQAILAYKKQLRQHAIKEIDELRQLITKPLTEIYKEKAPESEPNRYTAIRKLSECLEKEDCDANEIALLKVLIEQIIKDEEGSLEKVLMALYVETKIHQKRKHEEMFMMSSNPL